MFIKVKKLLHIIKNKVNIINEVIHKGKSIKAINGWINDRSLIYWKETHKQISDRKLELEEKVAKSKAKVKVFEDLEQPTTALKTWFASNKNASCGKTMLADTYWNVPMLDAPRQRCTDRREHGRYLTRNFWMIDPDFNRKNKTNNPNKDLNTSMTHNWKEANET